MTTTTAQPKLITWGGYLGLAVLVALPLAVLTVRAGVWQQGLMLFALSCVIATVLFLLFIILLILPAFRTYRSELIKRSLWVLPGTALLLSLMSGGGDYPAIHDISTDTLDPPLFEQALAERGPDANPLTIKPDSIAAQKSAYPGITSLRNKASFDANFDAALTAAAALDWTVYASDRDDGRIEAVATTAIMGFKDDVVIRLRRDGEDTVVDMRSVSRVGGGDMGANAKRIRAFADAFKPQI